MGELQGCSERARKLLLHITRELKAIENGVLTYPVQVDSTVPVRPVRVGRTTPKADHVSTRPNTQLPSIPDYNFGAETSGRSSVRVHTNQRSNGSDGSREK